jgi:hypothetical protein
MVPIQIHQKQLYMFHPQVHHQLYIHNICFKKNEYLQRKKNYLTYFPSSFHGAKHRSPVFHLIAVRADDDAAVAVLCNCAEAE